MKAAGLGEALKARLGLAWDIAYRAGQKWSSDNVPRLSAAVSFYAALSLAPFIVFATVLAVYVIKIDSANHFSLIGQARSTLGSQAADLLTTIVRNAQHRQGAGIIASLISFVVMFFSASNLFLQFDEAVRSIWGIQQRGSFIKFFVQSRMTAFASVILAGLALIAWLYVDTRMAIMAEHAFALELGRAISFITAFILVLGVCSLSMKRYATVPLTWREVWPGALVAALSISFAKYLLSLYFANSSVGNVYGPAGALVVILLWIYYCSQIYFFGLEIVCVCAARNRMRAEETNGL